MVLVDYIGIFLHVPILLATYCVSCHWQHYLTRDNHLACEGFHIFTSNGGGVGGTGRGWRDLEVPRLFCHNCPGLPSQLI